MVAVSRWDCPHRDTQPDSWVKGWCAYFRGAVETTTDPETDAKLYALGWQAAKREATWSMP